MGAIRIILLGCLLTALPATGQAIPIRWTLQDVTFSDGGTATGFFVVDDISNVFGTISITTTAGAAFDGAFYETLEPGLFNLEPTFLTDNFEGLAGENRLQWVFESGSIGNTPLTLDISFGQEWECNDSFCSDPSTIRFITGGQLVGEFLGSVIPIPGGFWLLASAVGSLGWLRRRSI